MDIWLKLSNFAMTVFYYVLLHTWIIMQLTFLQSVSI